MMKTDNWLRIKLIIALLLSLTPLGSQGALVTERYRNDSDITELFLWSDDTSVMTFAGVDLSDPKLAGWTVLDFGDRLVLEGPEVKMSLGKFDIDFDYSVEPFTAQAAEVLFDEVAATWTLQKTGKLEFDGTKLKKPTANPLSAMQIGHIDAHFSPSPAAVPIPSSALLMVSAIAFLGVAARKDIATAATARRPDPQQ